MVFGARCRVTEGADLLETLLLERLTAERFVLFPEENVADFFGVLVLTCRVTVGRCEAFADELRTALLVLLTVEFFIFTALPELEFPCLTAVLVLFLADLASVALRTLVAEEFRVAAEFCLTEEFVLLLTAADFLSALFLRVTALLLLLCTEDFTAVRVPTLSRALERDL